VMWLQDSKSFFLTHVLQPPHFSHCHFFSSGRLAM
jgi:hypothetical protein